MLNIYIYVSWNKFSTRMVKIMFCLPSSYLTPHLQQIHPSYFSWLPTPTRPRNTDDIHLHRLSESSEIRLCWWTRLLWTRVTTMNVLTKWLGTIPYLQVSGLHGRLGALKHIQSTTSAVCSTVCSRPTTNKTSKLHITRSFWEINERLILFTTGQFCVNKFHTMMA